MKILRIIARLNVGGPARHVVWLAHGMKSAGYETLCWSPESCRRVKTT